MKVKCTAYKCEERNFTVGKVYEWADDEMVCDDGFVYTTSVAGSDPDKWKLSQWYEFEVVPTFKVGDRVRFKSWEQMEKEFGLDRDDNIKLRPCFTKRMKHLCGTTATITSIDRKCVNLNNFSTDGTTHWYYCEQMLEPAPDTFSIEDIKVGYVLECKCEGETHFMMVLPNDHGDLGCSGPDHWFPLKEFNDDFCYGSHTIMKIYGLTNNRHACMVNGEDREIIWQRKEEKKEMTVAEIEKELGYQIKIIK